MFSSRVPPPQGLLYKKLITESLTEDIEHGDITTALTIDPEAEGSAVIVAKESAVVAGAVVARDVFRCMDPELTINIAVREGDEVDPGAVVMNIKGGLAALLQAERVALNFLQRLSGTATLTRSFVREIAKFPCRIVDTRKTTPGLRILQKYAVRVGGGYNHRFCLSDGILIKDNHIAACGSVREAVQRARAGKPHTLVCEVEVSTLEELKEALDAGADALLLDNMTPAELAEAVRLGRGLKPDVILEASGGINIETVKAVAESGVDIISVGALTHSARAVDMSMRIDPAAGAGA